MLPPCLTLSIIRYRLRVKWSNSGNGVVPFPTPRCSSYWKGSLQFALDYSYQLYFYLYICYAYSWYISNFNYQLLKLFFSLEITTTISKHKDINLWINKFSLCLCVTVTLQKLHYKRFLLHQLKKLFELNLKSYLQLKNDLCLHWMSSFFFFFFNPFNYFDRMKKSFILVP